jgi:hypothetical protein
MKREVSLVVILVCIVSSEARPDSAAVAAPGKNLLLVNPGDLFTGVVSLEYERALAPFFGLSVGLSVWAFHSLLSPATDPDYTSISPELGARLHLIRGAPGGLFLGPYVTGGYLFARSGATPSRPWSWGVGGAVGYNFIVGQHFTFQIGAGYGFTAYGAQLVWFPRLRLGLGAVF